VKGPRLTERDLAVLRFIAEQRAVRGDVVRRLLAAHAGAVDLTARTLLRHVGRWEQLGLVRREHFQLGRREPIPGAWTWLYLTRRGDARVGLGRLEPVTLDLGDRKHLHAVTVTRLALEADGWGWEPERLLGPRYAELVAAVGMAEAVRRLGCHRTMVLRWLRSA
jgi:hypothetical protein